MQRILTIITLYITCYSCWLEDIDLSHLSPTYWITSSTVEPYDHVRVKRSVHNCEEMQINLTGYLNLTLCIFRRDMLAYDVIDERTKLIEYERDGPVESLLYQLDFVKIDGYIVGEKETSTVDGYLLDNVLLGRLFINDRVFYIEELERILPGVPIGGEPKSVVYELSKKSIGAVKAPPPRKKRLDFPPAMTPPTRNTTPNPNDFEGKEVNLAVHIDPAFFVIPLQMNRKRCIFSIIHMIYVMNSVYRSTDFFGTGHPSNLGFYTVEFTLSKDNYMLVYPPYMAMRITANIILNRLHRLPQVLNSAADMHILFTGQEPMSGVVGFSPVAKVGKKHGGICTKTGNTMFISFANSDYNSYAMQSELDASTAHEMGHSFGAEHDPHVKDTAFARQECQLHLMGPTTNKMVDLLKGYQFSNCSLDWIVPILDDDRKCFHDVPSDRKPFCGNSIVDQGEECDCGVSYICKTQKSCCNTYDSEEGPPCTLKKDPFKGDCNAADGFCCTAGCKFRNLTYLDLTCTADFINGCPCRKSSIQTLKTVSGNQKTCACGINGQCRGEECHSVECTRLNLTECTCPRYPTSSSKDYCQTCCQLDEDSCVPAYIATRHLLEHASKPINVKPFQVKDTEVKTAVYERFCVEGDKGNCSLLMFRQFPFGEFCLFHGHVGKCMSEGFCYVSREILHRQTIAN